ncbi:CAAD domain-containing protein [Chloropicon primus]|uniref:Cyanobacterial aminoacyl-tRNA synthetase CAAD domain-containing protein n=1 Tax=Chloropicon primus TaxID=1764295 RepID=A0A5B8MNC5_9CHLO|nr:hypothetical protein A3770_07p46760 [Chloropicon primus]UPR01376.1 CAAD domain-containing protein [Chloropicon primus]|eukprot:QDZ22158.1 hypothetical protein A3770_07p46760 [Chloropicon primus]
MSSAVRVKASVASVKAYATVVGSRSNVCRSSSLSSTASSSLLPVRRGVRVQAGNDLKDTAQDLLTTATEKWEETEDKPTVVTLGLAGLVTLIVLSSLLGALDKVPFLGGILELVGIGYAAYFAYNNLLFTPDREELMKKVDDLKSKVL